ncbi:hypothetical protein BE20_24845 [Sorangium cellulosum]|uniref:Uncharacterized protein n=1 Tax=Sorangium cellulosum TaxID=56 RepID=A0A150SA66_SORCE|nr:hypothetical protein BE20_24845 [Sorangium cellulosum]KYF89290.1 hypothetical protein BE18_22925 [Sorangium cellulosum]
MASPICLVNGSSTLNGVDVPAGATVTIALADIAGVKSWSISCINTDELLSAATVTAGLTIDHVAKTATFTAPAAGSALIFLSKVNNGLDANGRPDPSLTTTFGVFVLTATGYRVGAFDEKLEGSSQFGWISKFNPLIRGVVVNPASAGAGLAFSSGAYNVGQNADGSIVVNADDIQLKPAYQSLLDNATVNATANALVRRDGSGGSAFASVTTPTIKPADTGASAGTTLSVTGSNTTTGSPGAVTIRSGVASSPSSGQGSGNVTIQSFDKDSAFQTGAVQVFSGSNFVGPSGAVFLETGTAGTSSGLIYLHSGVASGVGNKSGDIFVVPGSAGSGATRGNIVLIDTATPSQTVANGQGVIGIGNVTSIPTSNPVGGGCLYAQTGSLRWRGSSGTVTTIAPAEPHCPKCGSDFALEFENAAWGDELTICLPCMLGSLEKLGIDMGFAIRRRLNPEVTAEQRKQPAEMPQ